VAYSFVFHIQCSSISSKCLFCLIANCSMRSAHIKNPPSRSKLLTAHGSLRGRYKVTTAVQCPHWARHQAPSWAPPILTSSVCRLCCSCDGKSTRQVRIVTELLFGHDSGSLRYALCLCLQLTAECKSPFRKLCRTPSRHT